MTLFLLSLMFGIFNHTRVILALSGNNENVKINIFAGAFIWNLNSASQSLFILITVYFLSKNFGNENNEDESDYDDISYSTSQKIQSTTHDESYRLGTFESLDNAQNKPN